MHGLVFLLALFSCGLVIFKAKSFILQERGGMLSVKISVRISNDTFSLHTNDKITHELASIFFHFYAYA